MLTDAALPHLQAYQHCCSPSPSSLRYLRSSSRDPEPSRHPDAGSSPSSSLRYLHSSRGDSGSSPRCCRCGQHCCQVRNGSHGCCCCWCFCPVGALNLRVLNFVNFCFYSINGSVTARRGLVRYGALVMVYAFESILLLFQRLTAGLMTDKRPMNCNLMSCRVNIKVYSVSVNDMADSPSHAASASVAAYTSAVAYSAHTAPPPSQSTYAPNPHGPS